jgi:hypothetical protein
MLLILSVTALSPAVGGESQEQVSGAVEFEPVDFQPLDMGDSEEDATEDSGSEDEMEPPKEDDNGPKGTVDDSEGVVYENCDAARAAGATNIPKSDPAYAPHLDGDGDGIACEEPASNESVIYENCDAARAAGAAPINEGEHGYGPHLDRDGDGVACEPKDCDAVGRNDIPMGDPEYAEHLDRDKDGIACES